MKSILIKDENGDKLIKIYTNGKGEYFVERASSVAPFTCVITLESKERITIPSSG
jgi:hypothetical protein